MTRFAKSHEQIAIDEDYKRNLPDHLIAAQSKIDQISFTNNSLLETKRFFDYIEEYFKPKKQYDITYKVLSVRVYPYDEEVKEILLHIFVDGVQIVGDYVFYSDDNEFFEKCFSLQFKYEKYYFMIDYSNYFHSENYRDTIKMMVNDYMKKEQNKNLWTIGETVTL